MNKLDRIIINGIRIYGYHGIHPEEKKQGQWFEVDVELYGDLAKAGQSDDIRDTVNYSEVYKTIKRIVEGPNVNLLERLTQLIAEALLALEPVHKVRVRARKPGMPLGGAGGYASVEIVRRKKEWK